MKSTFPLSVAAGWARLVAVFVVDVGLVAAGAAIAGRPGWWTGVGVAVLVALAGAAALARCAAVDAGVAITGRATVAAGGAGAASWPTTSAASGLARSESARVGPHLVAVVAVDGPPHSPSVLDYPRVESLAKLPLEAVAAGLRQFDVSLEGIDIVSVGRAARPAKRITRMRRCIPAEVGDHPAVGQRRTWLVVRLNALRQCPRDCVARVGGGHDERGRGMAGRGAD